MTKANTKTDALLDDLLQDCESPEDILREHGLLKSLTKRLLERALAAELTNHLGYAPHVRTPTKSGNTRNGTSAKTVETAQGPVELKVPRIAPAPLSRWSLNNGNDGWRALMTRGWLCMPMGCDDSRDPSPS